MFTLEFEIVPFPRYTHDCDRCTFLGNYNAYDLYYCTQCNITPTVIARFSDRAKDYLSGLRLATPDNPPLYEAKRLAHNTGLIKHL